MKLTHAMVLAAGLGTRMRPLTETMPKPLIPVAGKPLIDWCLDWVADAGIEQVVVNTSYRAQQLEDHLSGRAAPHITTSREEGAPLETGGGIARALPFLGETPFVSLNSDAIFPPAMPHPIAALAEAWDDSLDFLMLLVPTTRALGWKGNGDFIVGEGGKIRRPHEGEQAPYLFTGVEVMHPRVFLDCPTGAFSLSALWRQRVGADGWYTRIRAIIHEGDWLNVGDLPGLEAANHYFSSGA